VNDLLVNEMFQTIQGEGTHAGTPSVFIRLQGCPVGCPWCDTRFTWHTAAVREVSVDTMIAKDRSGDASWATADTDAIMTLVDRFQARHVVITGGEPCLYDLRPLTQRLLEAGRRVQIETSGTHAVAADARTWVTVSPKIAMPGGFPVRPDALARADEIKMPVGRQADIDTLLDLLGQAHHRPNVPVFLQPLSTSRKATELCAAAALAHDFRLSVQLHALLGWR
jgi:7-carboxy-7-deazaguanine synthase